MISFIIGLFVGCFIGMAIMTLLAMARDPEPPKQEKHEPAKLWTKGNLCQWKGGTYVIYAMETDEQNQTVAILGNGHDAVIAPIEELEEVEEWT
jgi:hypothetical protein